MAAKPTKKQTAYVENVAKGLSRDQSAILAGFSPSSETTMIEKSPTIHAELARIRAETAANTGVTKEDVVEMLLSAANMAKMMADPQGLVAAARELGKMLGYYAPEVRKTLAGIDKDSLKAALNEMSDEELMRVANARTIDGQATKLLPEKDM